MWIAYLVSAAVFLICIGIGGSSGTRKMGRITSEEWLFSHGFEKVYAAVYGNADPEQKIQKLGISYDKYLKNCRLLRINPNWRKEAGKRLIGIFVLVISFLISIVIGNIAPAIIGVALFLFMGPYQEQKLSKCANEARKQMADTLPHFIDLFQTALEIGVPVESAIRITAINVPCLVSKELLLAMAETEIGAKDWQRALEEIALRYDVSVFSDFVLAIVASYEKGIPIAEIVARKSMEIKQINLLDAKERAARLSNTILLPVMVFKILPLLAIMLIPIMVQISSM